MEKRSRFPETMAGKGGLFPWRYFREQKPALNWPEKEEGKGTLSKLCLLMKRSFGFFPPQLEILILLFSPKNKIRTYNEPSQNPPISSFWKSY